MRNLSKKGQGLTEYIVLVALISIASLGIVEVLGGTIRSKLAAITTKLQGGKFMGVEVEEAREKHYRKRSLRDFWKTNE